jgi:hypothetical protein
LALLFSPAFDARKIDFANFGAYASEELDMDRTWAGRIMALGRSDLSRVKEALCRGWIPISTAVLAVKDVEPDEQDEWVAGVRSGDIRPRKKKEPLARVDIEDPEKAAFVDGVFRKARVVMGYRATDPEVERHVLGVYRERRSGKQLVKDAQARREPPPKRTTPFDPLDDPAAPFLGPRVMPRDEKHLQELIETCCGCGACEDRARRALRPRGRAQALPGARVPEREGDGRRALPSVGCARSRSTRRSSRDSSTTPELEEALAEGMDVIRVLAISDIATEENVARWIASAGAWGDRAPSRGRVGGRGDECLRARALRARDRGNAGCAHVGSHQGGAPPYPKPPRRIEGVHPELYDACVYYDREVQLPKLKGFPSVRSRERHCCENPLCNCESLRTRGTTGGGGSTVDRTNRPTPAACAGRAIGAASTAMRSRERSMRRAARCGRT